MAVALYSIDLLKGGGSLVGLHLGMFPAGAEWEGGNTVSCANYYAKKVAELGAQIRHAAFVGDARDWASPAAGMCLQLNIPNALFVSKATCDVWALPNGEVVATACTGSNKGRVPPDVGARFRVKAQAGYRGDPLFVQAMQR